MSVNFTPTDEQTAVLDLFATGVDLAVQAAAGTGKTATLDLIASANPDKRFQYVAFNTAIVKDSKARMPANVACSTMHSLAIRGCHPLLRARLNGVRLSPRDRAKAIGVTSEIRVNVDGQTKVLNPGKLSGMVMRAITVWCQSDAPQIEREHFPYVDGLDTPVISANGKTRRGYENNDKIARALLPKARALWPKLIDPNGTLPFKHEYYLKLAQLGHMKIPVDVILFDEAQDASPVMAAIVADQTHAQLVFVGDAQQAIYGFTGAIDAMQTVPAESTAYLTQSFRFGPAVAHVANVILAQLEADLRVKGLPTIESTVNEVERPDAVLTRTNAVAVERVLDAQKQGLKPHLVGGGGDIVRFAQAALDLQSKGYTGHPELQCFTSWGEVQHYVEFDDEGSDLALNVKLVDEYGPDVIIAALDDSKMATEDRADVVVSTAHKSKGRQWPKVQLAQDFPGKSEDRDYPLTPDDLRLLYVAVTRAQHQLDVTRVGLLAELLGFEQKHVASTVAPTVEKVAA